MSRCHGACTQNRVRRNGTRQTGAQDDSVVGKKPAADRPSSCRTKARNPI